MDELLHHCLRELAFDGDLGCSVSRLKDFIIEFYSRSNTSLAQNPDDAFYGFVWSLVVQHPTVRVGLIPDILTSEVWIAPQISAKRKAKARGEEHVETKPPELEPVPNAKTRTLDDLTYEYGSKLRIALDPDAIYAAITGSHIRFAKLSPMVYSALQIITRGRDNGVTVVGLGQQSKYDQKTCFYLVRQLTELDLVVKVRRGGVGTHFCIHKYFFERNPSWKAIRDEETQAEGSERRLGPLDADGVGEDDSVNVDASVLDFSPIDARHLSSLPLIRARVVKLLKASKNNIHASNNMLITLGFSNPTKTDRRFFQSRIRELIQQGVIEKVVVPSSKKKSGNASVKCFRLVSGERSAQDSNVVTADGDDEDKVGLGDQSGVKMNVTIHRQIADLLDESGTTGMTLNELSAALGQFDKRTIELLLTRADKYPPPSHLSDLGIAGLMETSGRERRHRYYTVAAYRSLIAKEGLDKSSAGYSDVKFTGVGDFLQVGEELFYDGPDSLFRYQDTFKDKEKEKYGTKQRKHPPKNPILPDGSIKQGRPRKRVVEEVEPIPPVKKRRGRPPKSQKVSSVKMPRTGDLVSGMQTDTRNSEQLIASAINSEKNDIANSILDVAMTSDVGDVGQNATNNHNVHGEDSHGSTVLVTTHSPDDSNIIISSSLSHSLGTESRPEIDRTTSSGHECLAPNIRAEGTQDLQRTPWDASSASATVAPNTTTITDNIVIPESLASCCIPWPDAYNDAIIGFRVSAKQRHCSTRINVSHLRRENELWHVIQDLGGIVNIQTKEFFDAHTALIEALAKAGEPTSAPVGTRTDKRTATKTLNNLEQQGRIKQIKASMTTHTGVVRQTCPPPPQLGSFVKIDECVEYGADPTSSSRGALPLQLLQLEHPSNDRRERWSKNIARADQLFKEVLLAERTTLGQMYGFIVGKAVRARELHLSMLRVFETPTQSSNIVSKEKRIVDLAFFCHDLSLDLYCSLVSSLTHDEDLTRFFASPNGHQTLVRDLPPHIHSKLQIGHIMETLRLLQLVVPLRPSESAMPWITCERNGDYPCAFDKASIDGGAPVHIWAESENNPPFWKEMPLKICDDGIRYWNALRDACTNPHLSSVSLGFEEFPNSNSAAPNVSIGRSLRRSVSWNPEYILTWHQMQYLRQFVDVTTGDTPLQQVAESRVALMTKICWVTSAPQKAVESYYKVTREKIQVELENARKRSKDASKKKARRAEETRVALARKAEEARLHREQEWDTLLQRIYPKQMEGPHAIRLGRVKKRFLQSGSTQDTNKWESEIVNAVREADLAAKKVLKFSGKRAATIRAFPGPAVMVPGPAINPSEPSVRSLVERQAPLTVPLKEKSRRKRGRKDEPVEETKSPRRTRFQWNREYDELARDASAIIKARCRGLPRLDWAAFEQVFPAVPRNTVRQRLSHIKDTPGNETYLARLEDKWYDLWTRYRGTTLLPDDDPQSTSNFDLIQHVDFLRKHVDKNALRVGFVEPTEPSGATIPVSIDRLFAGFELTESGLNAPTWDFMWNASVEEGREKRAQRQPFTKFADDSYMSSTESHPDALIIAEAALKMVMGMPPEVYHPERASLLLRSVGEGNVAIATKNLLGKGILSKSHRDPQRQQPGRQLKVSENNQNAIGGIMSRDVYQDAVALDDLALADHNWREWPFTATDGDSAALIQLVSDNLVEFKVDTTHPQSARPSLDWNSKKADDDQIECDIFVRFNIASSTQFYSPATNLIPSSPVQAVDTGDLSPTIYSTEHSMTSSNEPACCRLLSEEGVVDCMGCLSIELSALLATLNSEAKSLAIKLLEDIRNAGEDGIRKKDLMTPSLIQRMTECEIPLLFWVGYSTIKLVSATYARHWTVLISEKPVMRIFPRRWLDIEGRKVTDFWEAAVRAVMSTVVFRPGISQTELRWRLRSIYDRQEVIEVLGHLEREGLIQVRRVTCLLGGEIVPYQRMKRRRET
ncbi:hypothetical protein BDQ17DRAFT_1386204 [Cyathus striatus]|nr:hypothetical protein BDQ17DRAFT_1386204 [Cyathus striatus]